MQEEEAEGYWKYIRVLVAWVGADISEQHSVLCWFWALQLPQSANSQLMQALRSG